MKPRHWTSIWGAWLWLATVANLPAQPYTFGTLAGDPSDVDAYGDPVGGYVDGANNTARFNFPQAVAVAGTGIVYVADTLNNSIRKVAREGTNWVVTTVAGSGPSASGSADGISDQARFNFPQSVAVDGAGNLYVADAGNHTIRKLTPAGGDWVVTTIAGAAGSPGTNDGPGSAARFGLPVSVAVDGAANVYVADYTENTIRKLAPEGTNWVVSTIAGRHSAGSADGTNDQACFNGPGSIAADNAGRLYVSDWFNSTVRQITPLGTNYVVRTIAGMAGEAGWVDGPGAEARFSLPLGGIGADSAGQLYVTDAEMIRKLTPVGTNWVVTTIAGLQNVSGWVDGMGSEARFYYPQAVGVDPEGNLYVADSSNNAIRIGVPWSVTPPVLQVTREAGKVILSWPAAAAAFVPESASTPQAGAVWTPLTNSVGLSDGNLVLTNGTGPAREFYRLRLVLER